MKFLEPIINFINNLDEKNFYRYLYITISVIILLFAYLTYRYFSTVSSLQKELRKINISRQETQTILARDVKIKNQKALVDEMLEKDKNFKLMQYFDSVVNKLSLTKNVKSTSITTSEMERFAENYIEVKLDINLINMNTKQLVDFLSELDKNERIYTKGLEITKANKTPSIDVNLTIATLQPKIEAEVTE